MSSTDERSAASPLLEASEFRLVVPSRLKSGLSATGALLLVLVPLAAVLAATRLGPLDTLDFWKAAPLFLLVVGLPLAVLWAAIMTRRIGEPVIELQPKAVLLPIDSSGTKRAEVPYESIEAANLRAYSRFAFVAVRAAGRTFTYATRSFRPPEAAEAFLEALRARIAMSPGGAARLAGMDRLTVLAQEMGSKRTWVTHALLVLIAVGFAIEHFTGALGDPAIGLGMIRLGANARSLVHEGQVFRLVSANFLHAGVLHIVLNSVALLSVGGLIERLVGGWAFLAIYLASGIGGALASAAFGHATLSIGASTAIFGLLGCLATASLHFGGGPPGGISAIAIVVDHDAWDQRLPADPRPSHRRERTHRRVHHRRAGPLSAGSGGGDRSGRDPHHLRGQVARLRVGGGLRCGDRARHPARDDDRIRRRASVHRIGPR